MTDKYNKLAVSLKKIIPNNAKLINFNANNIIEKIPNDYVYNLLNYITETDYNNMIFERTIMCQNISSELIIDQNNYDTISNTNNKYDMFQCVQVSGTNDKTITVKMEAKIVENITTTENNLAEYLGKKYQIVNSNGVLTGRCMYNCPKILFFANPDPNFIYNPKIDVSKYLYYEGDKNDVKKYFTTTYYLHENIDGIASYISSYNKPFHEIKNIFANHPNLVSKTSIPPHTICPICETDICKSEIFTGSSVIFLVRQNNKWYVPLGKERMGPYQTLYNLPGGKLDHNCTLKNASEEIVEEFKIILTIDDIKTKAIYYVHRFQDSQNKFDSPVFGYLLENFDVDNIRNIILAVNKTNVAWKFTEMDDIQLFQVKKGWMDMNVNNTALKVSDYARDAIINMTNLIF